MTDLKELKKLAEAATQGEWVTDGFDETQIYQGKPYGQTIVGMFDYEEGGVCNGADSEFICAANPQTILDLLAHIQQLEEQIKELEPDAMRYQWLKTQDSGDCLYIAMETGAPGEHPFSIGGAYADREIDDAIAAQSTKEEA